MARLTSYKIFITFSPNTNENLLYMKRKVLSLIAFFCLISVALVQAQTQKVTGTVVDPDTEEPLLGASVLVQGTGTGTVTDLNGQFTLDLDLTEPKVLEISYIGYDKQDVVVSSAAQPITVNLKMAAIAGKEVVVTGSRVGETILESAATIQKMSPRDVKEVASGDFYQGLGTLTGVDITTSSMGFKVINMRGFNTTAPVRVVQFIDGMDNQAPGLNFPVGNLVGANDLDVHSVEVITGAASALYGPNAFQGVVSIKTKNPWDYQGLSVQLRGGSRNMIDGQIRYAKVLGAKQNFAIKVTGGYSRADDWIADDDTANVYGDIETDVDLSSVVEQLQYDEEITDEEREDFVALNNWLGLVSPNAAPGTITVTAPGYRETQISDNETKSLKATAELHYKIKDDLKLSYLYKVGQGTAIYQASNRYSINNILFQQHKLELEGKNFNVKAYTTRENAGDSYDIVFTAINLSKEGIANYVGEYLGAYFDTLSGFTDEFDDDATAEEVTAAHEYAAANVDSAWIQPGTAEFDSLRNEIINNSDLQSGSKFTDESKLYHVEGQYNFTQFTWADVIAGANFRYYDPQSYGTIFRDTLVNAGDTLENGSANLDAEFVDLGVWEVGGFVQASKKLLNDKFKIMASIRADKNENFDLQTSPRVTFMYNPKNNHHIRVSAQSAFRLPTLQNQYILLNVGPLTIAGNLDGWSNIYTLESVQDFEDLYEATYHDSILDDIGDHLDTVRYAPIKPEHVKTIELGYRGSLLKGKLFIDASVYFSQYEDFIGEIRVVQPDSGTVGQESGENDIIASLGQSDPYYTRYQIPVNAQQSVTSYGASIGVSYFFNTKYSMNANYTYAALDTSNLTDPIIPAFNTPNHKVNVGIKGRRVIDNFGFSANYKWVDTFRWESTFGDGDVPAYTIVDLQLSYEFPKYFSTIRVGASNLLNYQRQEAYGAPRIGRMFYVTYLFDIANL